MTLLSAPRITAVKAMHTEVYWWNFDEVALDCDLNPRESSKTEVRAELAQKRIPVFVGQLVDKMQRGHGLTARDVELLYSEYRSYFRSNPPFRMSLQNTVGAEVRSSEHDVHLLRQIAVPEETNKRVAFSFLTTLMGARLPR